MSVSYDIHYLIIIFYFFVRYPLTDSFDLEEEEESVFVNTYSVEEVEDNDTNENDFGKFFYEGDDTKEFIKLKGILACKDIKPFKLYGVKIMELLHL